MLDGFASALEIFKEIWGDNSFIYRQINKK